MVPNPTTDVADYNSLVSHSLCCIDNPELPTAFMKILYVLIWIGYYYDFILQRSKLRLSEIKYLPQCFR